MGSNRLTTARIAPRPSWRRFGRWRSLVFQFVLISLAALAYFAVRGLTESSLATARHNARDLMRFEDAIGIGVERSLQQALIGHEWIVTLANWIYIYGHWPVIALTLGALFARHPDRFRLLRNAMFISGAIGLLVFALYPVAPPRLMDIGIIDTVTERSQSYRTLQPPGLINKYAALPSLHFGWNLLVGVILWQTTRRRWVRGFAVAMPVAMAFAVVVTANHYVIDVVAGGALALLGLLIAMRLPEDLAAPLHRRRSG
jgi:membrane-associated phospholipid phosphatase